MMSQSEERFLELLMRFKQGDGEARELLVKKNLPLVHGLVKRFHYLTIEKEDLFQVGCIGLIKAVDRFDPGRGVKFSTYAVPVILGEIRAYLRDSGNLIKVDRMLQEKAAKIRRTRAEMYEKLGREPKLNELASRLEMEPEELVLAEDSLKPVLSIFHEAESYTAELAEEDQLIDRIAVKEVLNNLPVLERRLIVLRYFFGKSQQETGQVMGISQVQVSRLERKIKELLRSAMRP